MGYETSEIIGPEGTHEYKDTELQDPQEEEAVAHLRSPNIILGT